MSHKNAAINILLVQLLLVFLFTFVCSILIQLVIIFEETSVYKIYQTTEEDRDEMRRTDKQTETNTTSSKLMKCHVLGFVLVHARISHTPEFASKHPNLFHAYIFKSEGTYLTLSTTRAATDY